MRRIKFDDCRLQYFNDLFGIKLNYLQSESKTATLWKLYENWIWVMFNLFLLRDATDRSKISSNHHRIFLDVRLYPISLFANTPFNIYFIPCIMLKRLNIVSSSKFDQIHFKPGFVDHTSGINIFIEYFTEGRLFKTSLKIQRDLKRFFKDDNARFTTVILKLF